MNKCCAALAVGLGLMTWGCASEDGGAPDAGTNSDAGTASDAGEGSLPEPDGGEAPLASFVLGLALNDAVDGLAPRGWPMVLMGVAALFEEVATASPLDMASIELRVFAADGRMQTWPFERLTPLANGVTLDESNAQVEFVWTLTEEQTRALAPGQYSAQLAWAGQTSARVALEVVDLGPTGDPAVAAQRQTRLASLTARLALLRGDPNQALEVLDAALIDQPEQVQLLVWKAKAQEAAGALGEALLSIDTAAEIAWPQDATGSEPPVTVFETRRRIADRVIGGAL